MKTYTYWETEPGVTSIPPYILLGIASMRLALGDDFVLLTKRNIRDYVSSDYLDREWKFSRKFDHVSQNRMSIVAKSDFIRMHLIGEHGGCWIDADTIVLRDYRPELARLLSDKLLWHTEQFFCAKPGNTLLKSAAQSMLDVDQLVWGDPGGIKSAVREKHLEIDPIPVSFWDPGYRPSYNAKAYRVIFRNDISAKYFLRSEGQFIQKMYNTSFCKFISPDMQVSDFLKSDMLLSKIFKNVNGNVPGWIADCETIRDYLT